VADIQEEKLKRMLDKKAKLEPKTYLEELAEIGVLEYYVKDYLKERLDKDPEFRDKIYEYIYKHSKEINEDLEQYYLEQILESLSFFNQYTSEWQTITQ
jgi:transcription termination factor NusB